MGTLHRPLGESWTVRPSPAGGRRAYDRGAVYKTIFLLQRAPSLSAEEFRAYWLERHVPVVLAVPGLRGFVCNIVEGGSADSPPHDGLAELWWDDEAAFHEALATPEGKAAVADVERFTASHVHVVVDEHVALPAPAG
ncbi:MAG: hypothetical protein QOD44_1364, partial [Solirubrobacteraceae bacterium]|nr:hypothetical protein [Solirubrobacteraceae bacterium]